MNEQGQEQKEEAASADGMEGFSLISDQKLMAMYAAMVKCRMLEEKARKFGKRRRARSDGKLFAGLEAVVVGVTTDLQPEDTVIASAQEYLPAFVRGISAEEVAARLKSGKDMRLPWRDDGYTALTAAGAALCCQTQNRKNIAVAFLRGGSSGTGAWREALKFAGERRLPILFVDCSLPRTRKGAARTLEHGFPCITVDGHDVVAVYRVACEAIAHARKGNGPTLMECMTYGMMDRLPQRPEGRHAAKGAQRSESDAIRNMEWYLRNKGLFGEELRDRVAAEFGRELDKAMRATKTGKRARPLR